MGPDNPAVTHREAIAGRPQEAGAGVRAGYTADLVVVDGNPLDNFKVMYGTGTTTYGEDGKPAQRGGVRYTIKAGAVFDARALLRDVEDYVRSQRRP